MKIEVFKNNNKTLNFEFTTADGFDYDVPVGTEIKFTVKKSVTNTDEEIIFSKTITGNGGCSYNIDLTTEDTNLPTGIYYWDLKNITDGVTIKGPEKFIIKEVVLQNE